MKDHSTLQLVLWLTKCQTAGQLPGQRMAEVAGSECSCGGLQAVFACQAGNPQPPVSAHCCHGRGKAIKSITVPTSIPDWASHTVSLDGL